jgi:hypothetical protein
MLQGQAGARGVVVAALPGREALQSGQLSASTAARPRVEALALPAAHHLGEHGEVDGGPRRAGPVRQALRRGAVW